MTNWKRIEDGFEALHYAPGARVPYVYKVAYSGGGTWHSYVRAGREGGPRVLGAHNSETEAKARAERHALAGL